MRFRFDWFDAMTIRPGPTTQVSIRLADWPADEFLLWLPESVGDLWTQWEPEVGRQEFDRTKGDGLRWAFEGNPVAHVAARLRPKGDRLLATVTVTNRSHTDLEHVTAQNCFHVSRAPHFACDDFSRVYLRTEGAWRSLASLSPTVGLPMYYRPGFLEAGRMDSWRGGFTHCNQEPRADHPLMLCESIDGRRCVGTASDDYQCVFHNRDSAYLRCLHSQQEPVDRLAPGATAEFRQMLYFVDGGREACIEACEADIREGVLRP